jgi:hypothetical protein
MDDKTNFVYSEVIKQRKRFQTGYRIFLLCFFAIGYYLLMAASPLGIIICSIYVMLLCFEVGSGLFGRKNLFGGRLGLADETIQDPHVLNPKTLHVFIGKMRFTYKGQISGLIFIFLFFILPFAGMLKNLIAWQAESFSWLYLVLFIYIIAFIFLLLRINKMCIVLEEEDIKIIGLFRSKEIPYKSITRVGWIDLKRYGVRYFDTYLEILQGNKVTRIPILYMKDFRLFKEHIENIMGLECAPSVELIS